MAEKEEVQGENKEMIYEMRKAKHVWLTFFLFGWSYGSLDKVGLQIAYYLTAGGCGIWTLILLFTLGGKIKEHNNKIRVELGLTPQY